MADYLRRHWQGQQTLAWSFWVNLVAVRVFVFLLQTLLTPTDGGDYHHFRTTVYILVFVLHAVLLIWQLVGVVRAADVHFSEHGNMALVWGAQLGGVLFFMLTAVYALGAVQMTMQAPVVIDVLTRMNEEHASQYDFTLSDDGLSMTIEGSIELGITRALRDFLSAHNDIRSVTLNSSGGNIYEGRGLAGVFLEYELATHVENRCASACIIAFAGGRQRSAGGSASFGFHQYRVDASYTIIATDVAKEQRRDQQLLLDAGVSREFVDRVFSHPSESMWWPSVSALHEAKFLTTPGHLANPGLTPEQ